MDCSQPSITIAASVEPRLAELRARRDAIVTALTKNVDELYKRCAPRDTSLCLEGLPNRRWVVRPPAPILPTRCPEPLTGINIFRNRVTRREWVNRVARFSDSWLAAMAVNVSAKLSREDRDQLFSIFTAWEPVQTIVLQRNCQVFYRDFYKEGDLNRECENRAAVPDQATETIMKLGEEFQSTEGCAELCILLYSMVGNNGANLNLDAMNELFSMPRQNAACVSQPNVEERTSPNSAADQQNVEPTRMDGPIRSNAESSGCKETDAMMHQNGRRTPKRVLANSAAEEHNAEDVLRMESPIPSYAQSSGCKETDASIHQNGERTPRGPIPNSGAQEHNAEEVMRMECQNRSYAQSSGCKEPDAMIHQDIRRTPKGAFEDGRVAMPNNVSEWQNSENVIQLQHEVRLEAGNAGCGRPEDHFQGNVHLNALRPFQDGMYMAPDPSKDGQLRNCFPYPGNFYQNGDGNHERELSLGPATQGRIYQNGVRISEDDFSSFVATHVENGVDLDEQQGADLGQYLQLDAFQNGDHICDYQLDNFIADSPEADVLVQNPQDTRVLEPAADARESWQAVCVEIGDRGCEDLLSAPAATPNIVAQVQNDDRISPNATCATSGDGTARSEPSEVALIVDIECQAVETEREQLGEVESCPPSPKVDPVVPMSLEVGPQAATQNSVEDMGSNSEANGVGKIRRKRSGGRRKPSGTWLSRISFKLIVGDVAECRKQRTGRRQGKNLKKTCMVCAKSEYTMSPASKDWIFCSSCKKDVHRECVQMRQSRSRQAYECVFCKSQREH